ncbi:MBL fold metallo-hydrolase [Roseococcus sp. SYP-B2431]|uniref:MBL fold metallo-hydrolase n=1 Tax=Roseococcus sp. SYP-B2431 TaxID=2496640 RepID=UPI0010397912|nr:MBL fold metallo-hydrolase [Roseococcus sp. SYP-B2431]TCI00350.1 MBL fold metallo-hydrolase [Roseococcus sp. SYP-B2431]
MNIPFRREDALMPGEVETIAPGVRRIICNNPSAFTYRGTNTYLIGTGSSVAVLDPGPIDEAHLAAILSATSGETITQIVVSHTHRDHSPGVAPLKTITGATTYGHGPHVTPGESGDHSFIPEIRLTDGETAEIGGRSVTALFTPGHCGNHLCFALDGTGILFSADHVMAWSTSVVSPPDGNMRSFMQSIARLRAREGIDELYLPGHGPSLPDPMPFLDGLSAHRQKRETRIVAALREHGPATVEALVGPVYGPLDPRLIAAAGRSMLSQLIMLEEDGAAVREGEAWRLT